MALQAPGCQRVYTSSSAFPSRHAPVDLMHLADLQGCVPAGSQLLCAWRITIRRTATLLTFDLPSYHVLSEGGTTWAFTFTLVHDDLIQCPCVSPHRRCTCIVWEPVISGWVHAPGRCWMRQNVKSTKHMRDRQIQAACDIGRLCT
jgi:hypothetical protein